MELFTSKFRFYSRYFLMKLETKSDTATILIPKVMLHRDLVGTLLAGFVVSRRHRMLAELPRANAALSIDLS
jgi:hypothetical protein